MNRSGATSFALLMGVGSGLSLGVAIDVLVLLQGGQVPDLIGSLGLPGAILALVGAFFLGAKAYMTLRANGKTATGDTALNAERRTAIAVEKVLERIDLIRDEMRNGLKENRHDAREALATIQAEVLLELRRHLDNRP